MNNIKLLDLPSYHLKKYAEFGRCYQQRKITLSLISCIIKIGFSLHIIWNADISECCYFTSANNTFPNLHTSSDHSQPHPTVIIIIQSKYFWSAKIPSIIHHNQLLLTKFGKILWYVNWWHQSCSKIARLLND